MKTIEEKINKLPPEDRKEVEDFVEFLLKNRKKRAKGKPAFKWAGILRDLRDKYTSVELQHEISRWRIGEK
jgi:mRNA-degrading endonuclease RelE of RelBE toxin-antitoxin system